MPGFIVVGPGRAGRSLLRALQQVGWRADGVVARGDDVAELARATDVVLLTVPDDAIAAVAGAIGPGPAAVLHVSGAKGLDVLGHHHRRGSVHPLMSLPDADTGARRLTGGGVFAVAGDPAAAQVVTALGGRPITVDDGARSLYHAAAAVSANHLVALCAQVDRLADLVGVPADAYWDLMATTLDNVRRSGPLSSLTGPAARGDASTITQHLDALPPSEHDLYLDLATEAARLAGSVLPATIDPPGEENSEHVTMNDSERLTAVAERPPAIITTTSELRSELDRHRRHGRSVGFVPTMGYLHDGHASLMTQASTRCDTTAASIFVNPLQFAPDDDLDTYPRDLERDLAVAAGSGVDLLFVPTAEEMYPQGQILTSIAVADLSSMLEGASRPGHFDGVATVVTKLFSIVGPCRAYFGEKDFQQLAIVRRLASDLSLPVEIIACPIIREPDGLAMSSRNVWLTAEGRPAAATLSRALRAGAATIEAGERSTEAVEEIMAEVVAAEPLVSLDYAVAVDPTTLSRPDRLGPDIRLLIAARVDGIRLIDNCGVSIDPAKPKG